MQLRNMTAEQFKKHLTDIKPQLRQARFIDIAYNKRDSKLGAFVRCRSLKEFGTDLLTLIDNGYSQFTISKESNEHFTTFKVNAVKEFKQENINEFISRTGNYGC